MDNNCKLRPFYAKITFNELILKRKPRMDR